MLRRLIIQIIVGSGGLWLAQKFIPGVNFIGNWKTLLLAGATLGVFNFLFKPFLYKLTFPLRLVSLGLVSLLINIGLVWAVDLLFEELKILGILPLLLVTLMVWFSSFLLGFLN